MENNTKVENEVVKTVEEAVKNNKKAMLVTAGAFAAGIVVHEGITRGAKFAKCKFAELKAKKEAKATEEATKK